MRRFHWLSGSPVLAVCAALVSGCVQDSDEGGAAGASGAGGRVAWGDPASPPLQLGTAATALCGGGANREDDGSGGASGSDDEYGYATGGAGGSTGDYWSDAGAAWDYGPWGGSPGDPPDAQRDASVGGETADAQRDAGVGGEIPDASPTGGDDAAVDASPVDAQPPPPHLDARIVPDATPVDPERDAALGTAHQPLEGDGEALCEGIDLDTPRVLYMSADDSNSMASPVILRRLIRGGAASVEPRLVRTWEFLNYYRFDFDRPEPGDLNITASLGSCDLSRDLTLQIAVQSEAPAERPPMHVVLVLDTSGSMGGEPIELERSAVRAIAGALQAGDRVSAVTWSDVQTPLLEAFAVDGPDDPTVLQLAAGLEASGSTDLDSGLRLGYELAAQGHRPGVLDRVVLISDGQANLGVTSEVLIGAAAEDEDDEGTYLVGAGVGDGVNDTLMDTVTDAGRGAYVYLDGPDEAAA